MNMNTDSFQSFSIKNKKASKTISRVMSPPYHFFSVLLRMGFTYALCVTTQAVVSYTALPTLPASAGGIFLLHYP